MTRLILLSSAALLSAATACAASAAQIQNTENTGLQAIAGPPIGFDAVHATDAQLAAFALPPRPDMMKTPDSYAKWVRAMSARTTRRMAPLQATSIFHGPRHAANGPAGAANLSYSYNWSGVADTNSLTAYNSNRSFYYIIADYVIPGVTNATCDGTWDYSSSWVGIDGYGSNDVLQAGTESDAYCSSSGTNTYYSAWIEWYPYSESRISLPVAPGNDMFIEVWNTSPIQGYAYLVNLSTNQSVEYSLTPPSGTSLIGNSAEWVVERPGLSTGLATLPNYALDYMSGASAYNFNSSHFQPGTIGSTVIDMLDNNGNVISAPSFLGRSALQFTYE